MMMTVMDCAGGRSGPLEDREGRVMATVDQDQALPGVQLLNCPHYDQTIITSNM